MLLIENAGKITSEQLEDAFENQFGAIVMAEMTSVKYFLCRTRRKAEVFITSGSIHLTQFIRIIERNGTNTLVIKGVAYTVKLANLSRVDEVSYLNF
jgi:hypothetical protein